METLRFVMTSTFYPPYHLGGDAVHVKYLAEELAKRGHEVHVMHSRDAYRLKRKDSPSETDNGKVHVHTVESPYGRLTPMKVYAFGNSSFILNNYRKLVSDVKPEIVHHHNISLLGHGLLRKIGNYRQLYTAHDHWLICQKSTMMRNGQPCKDRHCTSCSLNSGKPPQLWRKNIDLGDLDCLICPSKYMAGKLAGLNIPLAILPNFSPEPPRTIPEIEEDNFFLYMGVLEEHKGIRVLLDAFAKSKNRLIIIGRGSMSGFVERTILERKMAPRVKYLGWKGKEKWGYLGKANALLIPSTGPENFPYVALEAMSVGTPVICSDTGGTAEAVGLLSADLVIPLNKLKSGLASLTVPRIPRDAVKQVFEMKFSSESYMNKYMAVVKGGCPST
ncbi:MAG: glycosyltransferase [Thermoplasmata archaeon]